MSYLRNKTIYISFTWKNGFIFSLASLCIFVDWISRTVLSDRVQRQYINFSIDIIYDFHVTISNNIIAFSPESLSSIQHRSNNQVTLRSRRRLRHVHVRFWQYLTEKSHKVIRHENTQYQKPQCTCEYTVLETLNILLQHQRNNDFLSPFLLLFSL